MNLPIVSNDSVKRFGNIIHHTMQIDLVVILTKSKHFLLRYLPLYPLNRSNDVDCKYSSDSTPSLSVVHGSYNGDLGTPF